MTGLCEEAAEGVRRHVLFGPVPCPSAEVALHPDQCGRDWVLGAPANAGPDVMFPLRCEVPLLGLDWHGDVPELLSTE